MKMRLGFGIAAGVAMLLSCGVSAETWPIAEPPRPAVAGTAPISENLRIVPGLGNLGPSGADCGGACPWDEATDIPPVILDPLPEKPTFRGRLDQFAHDVASDYKNYYGLPNFVYLGAGVGLNAVLANTTIDQSFADWYQQRVRTSSTDQVATFWKTFGEGGIFVPAWAGLALVGTVFEDRPLMEPLGEFGRRTSRAYLVGGPTLLLGQYVIGSARPSDNLGSQWSPFAHTNGVSGHAFIGSVPFVTAAKMVDDPWLKGGLYFCSTLTAWSRVNDNQHYLSQAILGWWMGYLSASAVDQTQQQNNHLHAVPLATPELTGVGLVWTR